MKIFSRQPKLIAFPPAFTTGKGGHRPRMATTEASRVAPALDARSHANSATQASFYYAFVMSMAVAVVASLLIIILAS